MDQNRPEDDGRRTGTGAPSGHGRTKRLVDLFSVEGLSAADAPAVLCRACVDLLDITGASISLYGGDTGALWWSSDPVAERLAEAQYTLGDGPCRTASRAAAPVLAADLTKGPDARRWPVFAQQAVELGVRAVFSLPLGAGGLAIGTLDLYRDTPGPLSEQDQSFAFPVSEAITSALLSLHSTQGGRNAPFAPHWLDGAENDHEEVHQATGMIMVHLGVDPEYALARLRAHAFVHAQSVTEAARDVIAGKIRFHE
ncbi:GAF and ANTAR domain-containing protein [Streptomyces globisporus]|uniref:GAF and ANTAR domain-containing protein n=1 Tax=Streptomyces globisporus TaxID=1908 RepID=UPI000B003FCE|nr:GAF and ANTAR domain-containing protein [Streptomyces globisporus]